MNILYEKLPDTICIDGEEYGIHTDFRRWIEIELILTDKLTPDNVARAIILCYKRLPGDIKSAMDGIVRFYSGDEEGLRKKRGRRKAVYSYRHDAELIYAAFWERYGIKLNEADLHWYEFRALFKGLGECRFTKIMEYRTVDTGAIKDKEKKKFYRRIQRAYALPDNVENMAENVSELF